MKADLIDYLDAYNGPQQHSISQLQSRLERTRRVPSLGRRHHREPCPTNKTELIARLFTWSASVAEYRKWKKTTEKNWHPILKSVKSFYDHPYFDGLNTVGVDGDVSYRIKLSQQKKEFDIHDYRFNTKVDIDYKCSFAAPSRQTDVEITIDNGLLQSLPKKASSLDALNEPVQYATAYTPEGLIFRNLPAEVISEILHHGDVEVMNIIDSLEPSGEETFIGTVDRISNAGNPVVEREQGHVILNKGKEACSYLIQPTSGNKARAIIEL